MASDPPAAFFSALNPEEDHPWHSDRAAYVDLFCRPGYAPLADQHMRATGCDHLEGFTAETMAEDPAWAARMASAIRDTIRDWDPEIFQALVGEVFAFAFPAFEGLVAAAENAGVLAPGGADLRFGSSRAHRGEILPLASVLEHARKLRVAARAGFRLSPAEVALAAESRDALLNFNRVPYRALPGCFAPLHRGRESEGTIPGVSSRY